MADSFDIAAKHNFQDCSARGLSSAECAQEEVAALSHVFKPAKAAHVTEAPSKCKLEYPKIPDRLVMIPSSGHQIDMEDSRFAAAAFSFTLCEAGQFLKALVNGYSERQAGKFSLFEKALP